MTPIDRCWPTRIARTFVTAVLLGISSAVAAEHRVASQQEFDAILSSLAPGDTVVFANGTWQDVKLTFRTDGTEGNPVTLRAESPGGTIFEGSSELVIDGSHLLVSGFKFQNNTHVTEIVTPYNVTVASIVTFTRRANHSRLTETAIVDSGEGVTTYVHLEPGNRHNRVDRCFFSNQGHIGVTFYVQVHPTQPNHHRIEHNYFGDRKPGTGNRWETMRLGHSEQQSFVSATTVSHNYFYRCNGENECVSNKSTGNRFLYNTFIETRGELTLRHGDRAWIEGNYFFGGNDPASQGVRVIGADHVVINNYFKRVRDALVVYCGEIDPEPRGYAPVVNALIAFNTIEDCANPFILGATRRPVPPKNLRIAYNLVQATSGEIVSVRAGEIDATYEGNIMFGAELGLDDMAGIDREKPKMTTDSWGRIFPEAESARVSVNLASVPEAAKDLNGELRTARGNVGAIGTHSSEQPLYPLSPHDVGPQWMGRTRE